LSLGFFLVGVFFFNSILGDFTFGFLGDFTLGDSTLGGFLGDSTLGLVRGIIQGAVAVLARLKSWVLMGGKFMWEINLYSIHPESFFRFF